MFIQPDISIIAVILGGVIVMLVGSIWYSPKVLLTAWAKEHGKKVEDVKPAPVVFLYMFLGALIQSFLLANIVRAFGANNILEGGMIGILLAVGLVSTTMVGTYMFAGRSWKLFMIDAGYLMVTFTLVAMLHSVWM